MNPGRRLCLVSMLLAAPMLSIAAQPSSLHTLDEAAPVAINTRFLLIGPDGGAVSDDNFQGRFRLIAFGYAACPDVCPTTLAEMADILKRLETRADSIQAIFISVDPERDTPQFLKTYTAFFDPRILGLSGTPELVQRAARNYKVRYARVYEGKQKSGFYAVDHAAGMFLVGPQGEFIKKFGFGTPSEQIAGEIAKLLPPQ